MIRLGKKVEYALMALVYMSKKSENELTTARELSDKLEISLELMGKLLQVLVKNHFIASVQGVKGGYYLAKPIESINMGAVIKAIDGPIKITNCMNGDICSRTGFCNIREQMQSIQSEIINLFEMITLKDFAEKN
ncbi:Rrf2 family transcriptional regulator [candidate division KSB1 bacterium]|nr:Rrf2 family transcriptional regulator [candidate division KSB1 bacterium]